MTPPFQIAHHRITSKLGEGGMGAVYRATDSKLNRDVVLGERVPRTSSVRHSCRSGPICGLLFHWAEVVEPAAPVYDKKVHGLEPTLASVSWS
jgi:serine/threonine protein kinase